MRIIQKENQTLGEIYEYLTQQTLLNNKIEQRQIEPNH
jgi:hypothetical protein